MTDSNETEKENENVQPETKYLSAILLPQPVCGKEKEFLLAVKRGDSPFVQRLLREAHSQEGYLDISCVDPLGRSALRIAIENENLELVRVLVDGGVALGDSLLHAIDQGFIEAVEFLLEKGATSDDASKEPTSFGGGAFPPEMTPLVLAAHHNNYEIVRLLLERGISIPVPHDVRCDCDECVNSSAEDSIRHSRCRLSAYRALVSPCLLALATRDPLLTAFELSGQLERLSFNEPEFRQEYLDLRRQCQQFAVDLLSQARSSHELKVLLNYDSFEDNDKPTSKDSMDLARLKLAIKCKQKKFVSHPNVQQLLSSLWFEGLPGFRRRSLVQQCMIVALFAALFPLCATCYLIAPTSTFGRLMRRPFIKFLMHSSSYLFFLFLLILASQDFETFLFQLLGIGAHAQQNGHRRPQRGNPPTINEWFIFVYILAFVWEGTKRIWLKGLHAYIMDMWNVIDLSRNSLYVLTVFLRIFVYVQDRLAISRNPLVAYIPREEWDDFDLNLIAEGLFAAANVFSALKLIHIFSVNPYLGPLQISLGRMVVDITKFFFFYTLVLFAFACGLTQLLSYYAALERMKCHVLPDDQPDWDHNSESCHKWRRFHNLFEASQSLFWASFGSLDLGSFELTGLKSYTRFWGLLMFGTYSIINVIVLLNLLIAMMNNSYNTISERSDMEWKFARTKLWLSYFAEGSTVPAPFNIIPRFKSICIFLGCRSASDVDASNKENSAEVFYDVTRTVVWRYLVEHQCRLHTSTAVTEDHVNELKQDISSFRHTLFSVLKRNGMTVPKGEEKEEPITILAENKMKIWERLLSTDFSLSTSSFADEKLLEIVDKWKEKRKAKGEGHLWNKKSQYTHTRMEDPADSAPSNIILPANKPSFDLAKVAIDMKKELKTDDQSVENTCKEETVVTVHETTSKETDEGQNVSSPSEEVDMIDEPPIPPADHQVIEIDELQDTKNNGESEILMHPREPLLDIPPVLSTINTENTDISIDVSSLKEDRVAVENEMDNAETEIDRTSVSNALSEPLEPLISNEDIPTILTGEVNEAFVPEDPSEVLNDAFGPKTSNAEGDDLLDSSNELSADGNEEVNLIIPSSRRLPSWSQWL